MIAVNASAAARSHGPHITSPRHPIRLPERPVAICKMRQKYRIDGFQHADPFYIGAMSSREERRRPVHPVLELVDEAGLSRGDQATFVETGTAEYLAKFWRLSIAVTCERALSRA